MIIKRLLKKIILFFFCGNGRFPSLARILFFSIVVVSQIISFISYSRVDDAYKESILYQPLVYHFSEDAEEEPLTNDELELRREAALEKREYWLQLYYKMIKVRDIFLLSWFVSFLLDNHSSSGGNEKYYPRSRYY